MYYFGEARDVEAQHTEIFVCKSKDFPMTYLGILVHFRKLRNGGRKKVEECFERRLSRWKGKHESIGGRVTLINSVLSSLPLYMMSFFAIPRVMLKKLDYFCLDFFGKEKTKRKSIAWPS